MKTRGIRSGVLLTLSSEDEIETIADRLLGNRDVFVSNIIIEIADKLPWELVTIAARTIGEIGGTVTEVRPAGSSAQPRGETQIVARTIRSGGKVESTGSIVVLGDVNSGAELMAVDDIIVLGTLRGLAHAGANGNENALIWAQEIRSPQLRIGAAVAQAAGPDAGGGPEVAHLREGNIVIRPWT